MFFSVEPVQLLGEMSGRDAVGVGGHDPPGTITGDHPMAQ
jgi:hypothetical protein